MTNGIRTTTRGLKGAMDRWLSRHVEGILSIPGSRLYRQFVAQSRDVERTQANLLSDILSQSVDTVFGREHGFGRIAGYSDYRAGVQVRDYEGHRPYVDRHAAGETDVLFRGKPIMYTRTSGTTAEPKLIPISSYNFQRTIKNRGKVWLYGLSRQFPGIFKGKDFTIVSPAVEGHTRDGTVTGSLSGLIYRNIPEFMKLIHTIPYEVITAGDYEAKAYTLLRFGVPSDVTSIFTGNPSTILNLATKADLWKEDLIRDVRDGTMKSSINLEPEIRALAEARLEPSPNRAAELEKLACEHEILRPSHYWPNLGLVHTWTNGNCRLVVPKLKPWFSQGTPFLDFGYIASEITAANHMDLETQGSLLAVGSAFYEFTLEEEGDSPGEFLLAHELEVGKRYYIYVTTLSGLYRYDMNDVMEVVGHFNQVPIIRFLYKGKGVTSITGEKLSEAQFIDAVHLAAKEEAVEHDFFVGYANTQRGLYELYIELVGEPSESDIDRFSGAVDRAIRSFNVEYDAKRHTERLAPIEIIPLGPNSFARYRRLRMDEGAYEGQFKWLHLSGTEATRDRMSKLLASRNIV